MAVVQIYQYFTVDLGGHSVKGGSLSQARSITLGDGEVIDRQFAIAPETTVKVFDAAEDESLGNFDFLWIESDRDVWIQSTSDAGTTDAYDVKELKGSGTAGQMGPALVLGSDDTQLLDGTVDLIDGTAGTIDEIFIKNQSSTEVARVRIVVAT